MKERIERLELELAELKASLESEKQEWVYWVFGGRLFTEKSGLAIAKVVLSEPMKIDSCGDWVVPVGSSFYKLFGNLNINKRFISDISAEDLKQRIIDMIEVV